ncbi:MAG TPA: TetR/AcrR family transcriptional regulator [Solirubrobacterales bacterium]|nr:TetR/AcrR family transcriptional regulator [Solirubrobacterales bacterium]
MNTMSTQTRKYELKARAESQRETRDRIAKATAELHEEKGVAQTTVAEIARRAGVTRLTVYNHFADLSELLPACAAHYEELHPLPDFGSALALAHPSERVRGALARLYGWYRETEPMYGKLLSDRASVPELDRFLEQNLDRMLAELADDLAAGFRRRGRRAERTHALVRLALDFWTWRRLSREGLDDEAAAELMAGAISTHNA